MYVPEHIIGSTHNLVAVLLVNIQEIDRNLYNIIESLDTEKDDNDITSLLLTSIGKVIANSFQYNVPSVSYPELLNSYLLDDYFINLTLKKSVRIIIANNITTIVNLIHTKVFTIANKNGYVMIGDATVNDSIFIVSKIDLLKLKLMEFKFYIQGDHNE